MTEDAAIACHLTAFICRHLICPSCHLDSVIPGRAFWGAGPESIPPSTCAARWIPGSLAWLAPRNDEFRLRQKSKFPNQINAESTVQSLSSKYFAFVVGQITGTSSRVPCPMRGALGRSSRVLDAGCDGRLWRDRRTREQADGEVVWS